MRAVRHAVRAYIDEVSETDPRALLLRARILAVLLGAIRAWASRDANNPAGIAYMDLADAYMRGDFANAINGYYGPLYPLLLGPALTILKPDPAWEGILLAWGFGRGVLARISDQWSLLVPALVASACSPSCTRNRDS
jgi:hypothetical protein